MNKDRIGVVFGVGIGGIHTFEEEAGAYALTGKELGPKYNPFFIPKMIADIASGHISIMYGFHGPNYTTTSACASSTNALADAFNLIRLGKADMILSGGAEEQPISNQQQRCAGCNDQKQLLAAEQTECHALVEHEPQLHHMGDQRHCAHRLQSADSPELDGLIETDQRRNAQQIEDHKCHKNTPNGGTLPPVF